MPFLTACWAYFTASLLIFFFWPIPVFLQALSGHEPLDGPCPHLLVFQEPGPSPRTESPDQVPSALGLRREEMRQRNSAFLGTPLPLEWRTLGGSSYFVSIARISRDLA